MASTEYCGLHQWEPGDSFLRTDFNGDFQKIDAAVHKLAAKLEADVGQYAGDDGTRDIVLGYRPKAVLVCSGGYTTVALDGKPNNNLSVTDTGFQARYDSNSSISVNRQYSTYLYVAFH